MEADKKASFLFTKRSSGVLRHDSILESLKEESPGRLLLGQHQAWQELPTHRPSERRVRDGLVVGPMRRAPTVACQYERLESSEPLFWVPSVNEDAVAWRVSLDDEERLQAVVSGPVEQKDPRMRPHAFRKRVVL